MIKDEECDYCPRIEFVMHRGMRTRVDEIEKGKGIEKSIWKEYDPMI
jgi:hypothetical protein